MSIMAKTDRFDRRNPVDLESTVRCAGKLKIETAGFDFLRCRNPPCEVIGALPPSLHNVDLRRPAAIIGKHPERRPHADAMENLGVDFEVAIFLRKGPWLVRMPDT
jgi:hypothetical protein